MKTRRSWWIAYGAGAAVVLLALGWVTAEVLRLERDAKHQESLRLALWRMDSWFAPRLAREAARPYGDYEPFHAPRQLYTSAELEPVESKKVLEPSPLLSFQSEIIPLHFQISAQDGITSPQAPVGGQRDIVVDNYLCGVEQLEANDRKLRELQQKIDYNGVLECVAVAEESEPPPAIDAAKKPTKLLAQTTPTEWQTLRNKNERDRRSSIDREAKQAQTAQVMAQVDDADDDGPTTIGSLVAIWIDGEDDETPQLVFTRRVQIGGEQILQGFLCDWPSLRRSLLDQITDLFVTASLVPLRVTTVTTQETAMLATIPVALEVPAGGALGGAGLTPARFTLALTWLAALTGVAAVGMTLRSSIAFGQKRSRFASAVTHELRTPLTTFRMYTEMLCDGMVTDDEQRATYLRTLKDESTRLSTLVENVLAYARLEEGRHASHAQDVSMKDLLERVAPTLERRAESAELRLDVRYETDEDLKLCTDVDAVGQILFNLVDNACKYACDGEDCSVELHIARVGDRLRMEVRDHGPGVPVECARTVFTPFERGENDCGEHPGIGLGLALSRSLARDLGGELSLLPPNDQGACFRLELPIT